MKLIQRALRRRRLLVAFAAEGHHTSNPLAFEYWCAARGANPCGAFAFLCAASKNTPIKPPHESDPSAPAYGNPRCKGWTPLHEAAYFGHAVSVSGLARLRPDWVRARDENGVTPMRALFLYNDTSPGWKHQGAFRTGERMGPIPSDEELARCIDILSEHGAPIAHGALCSAAHLGLSLCCSKLMLGGHAYRDLPDEHFPDWSMRRGFLARPIAGMSRPVASAMDADHFLAALNIALMCPSSTDKAHLEAFISRGRFDHALTFLSNRSHLAQKTLEIISDTPGPFDDSLALPATQLVEAALNLGADPHRRDDPSRSHDFFTPFESAARHGRTEIIQAVLARDQAHSNLSNVAIEKALALCKAENGVADPLGARRCSSDMEKSTLSRETLNIQPIAKDSKRL